jgi:DNA-binding MarR family transcriptional regulator
VDEIQAQWARECPDLDVSPLALVARLHRLGNRLTDELTTVYRRFGLSEGEFDLLATLRRSGGTCEVAAGELAAQTMVTTGAVSKRIDRLERAGLVERRQSDDDARGRLVRLTATGRDLIDDAFAAHMDNEARLVQSLSDSQRAQLEGLLRHWAESLDTVDSPGTVDGSGAANRA